MSDLPNYNPPTTADIQNIGKKLDLHLEENELTSYQEIIADLLKNLPVVDKYASLAIPATKYAKTPVRRPLPEENEFNGWARIVEIKGASSGPLTGKRIAIKDNMSITGVPLGNGSKLFDGYIPDYDATVVTRILDAGGTISGLSNCENLCMSINSFSCSNGPVLNPYNKLHSAGGSSGGSAVLVASSAVDIALGTDQGGSIRGPSSYCGLVGLKPTYGLVPYTGITPLTAVVDHVGPIAKTVHDCALLLQVIAGYDNGLDPRQTALVKSENYVDTLTGNLADLRIALIENVFSQCTPDVQKIVKDKAYKLTTLKASVSEISLPLLEDVRKIGFVEIYNGFLDSVDNNGISPSSSKGFQDVAMHDFCMNISSNRNKDLPPSVKTMLIGGKYIKEHHGNGILMKAINAARTVTEKFDEVFAQFDVLVMPTMPHTAPKLPTTELGAKDYIHQSFEATTNTCPFNVTGHPAITVNAGFSHSLPVGMMIVGRHFEDARVLNVAYAVEQLDK